MSSTWFDEVDEHRRRAAELLSTELRNIQSQNCLHLLEPILILFTLDVSFILFLAPQKCLLINS